MKYVYVILIVIAVLFAAYFLVPIAFAFMRILIGLGILAVFGGGVWVGYQFNKK